MEAKATAKFVRVPPRKARFVLQTIQGKNAYEALNQLRFTPNHAAMEIANVLRSAMANAEHNYNLDVDSLKVARCYADCGPTMKRVQPRAQGRAYRILKRTSHITVVVAEAEELPNTQRTAPRRQKREPLRAALPVAVAPVVEAPVAEETTVETPAEETPKGDE